MKAAGVMLWMLLGGGVVTGTAMQRSTQPVDVTSGMVFQHDRQEDDDAVMRRRIMRDMSKKANIARQTQMAHDANELLQRAAELQLRAQKTDGRGSQAEMLHEAETIEKLARDVKERMKGNR